MPLDKALNIKRMASAGLMLDTKELVDFVHEKSPTNSTREYSVEAQRKLDDIAETAKAVGRGACGTSCQLECAGIVFIDAVSAYDAELAARCEVPNCSDIGVNEAQMSFYTALPTK
jgi:hypothetical protein